MVNGVRGIVYDPYVYHIKIVNGEWNIWNLWNC